MHCTRVRHTLYLHVSNTQNPLNRCVLNIICSYNIFKSINFMAPMQPQGHPRFFPCKVPIRSNLPFHYSPAIPSARAPPTTNLKNNQFCYSTATNFRLLQCSYKIFSCYIAMLQYCYNTLIGYRMYIRSLFIDGESFKDRRRDRDPVWVYFQKMLPIQEKWFF